MEDTLIGTLRKATTDCHYRIEAQLALEKGFGLEFYGRVLVGFDRFLAAWEPQVRAALPAGLASWLAGRSRLAMARLDLEYLGIARRAGGAGPHLALAGPSAALGSLYVIEGSSLGGQVIARQLARDHGLGPGTGAAFFTGWGEGTGARWREFRALLDEHAAAGADVPAACAAAVRTFEGLAETFREVLR